MGMGGNPRWRRSWRLPATTSVVDRRRFERSRSVLITLSSAGVVLVLGLPRLLRASTATSRAWVLREARTQLCIAATALALLAACGGTKSPSSTASNSTGSTPTVGGTIGAPTSSATSTAGSFPNSCQLLSTAEVAAAVGGDPKQTYQPPQQPGDGNGCSYAPTTTTAKVPWVSVSVGVVPSHTIPATLRAGTTPVPGVGDEAYIRDGPGDQHATLYVRSGSTVLQVVVGLGVSGARQLCLALTPIALGHL
jgi:hypothetical protein